MPRSNNACAFSGDRVRAATVCPLASNCAINGRPIAPVPPATKIFISKPPSYFLLSTQVSRTGDLTFDAVRIGKIHTLIFASRREAGGFESRDRIGWIVIRDAVAVVIQTRLLALEERQPPFACG